MVPSSIPFLAVLLYFLLLTSSTHLFYIYFDCSLSLPSKAQQGQRFPCGSPLWIQPLTCCLTQNRYLLSVGYKVSNHMEKKN